MSEPVRGRIIEVWADEAGIGVTSVIDAEPGPGAEEILAGNAGFSFRVIPPDDPEMPHDPLASRSPVICWKDESGQ